MALTGNERKTLEQELRKTKETTANIVEAISSLNASLVTFKERSYQTMSRIRTAADLIVNEVRSHEEKLVARVQEIINSKEECVERQKKSLQDYVTELQQAIDYTSDVLNSTTEPEMDLNDWKSALSCQLDQVNGMKEGFEYELDVSDEGKFLFVYANQDLLKSMANYGTIINDIPECFIFDNNNGDDNNFIMEQQTLRIIPVVTLNGAIVDLDAVSELESEEESSDDESDSSYSNDDSSNGDDDDNDDDDNDDDDDDSDALNAKHSSGNEKSLADDVATGTIINRNVPRKPRLSTLI